MALSAIASCAVVAGAAVAHDPGILRPAAHTTVVDAAPLPGDPAPVPTPTPTPPVPQVTPPTTPAAPTAAPTTVPAVKAPPVTVKPSTTTTARPAPAAAPAATQSSTSAAATQAPTGVASHFAFLSHDGARPMRYDPCTPIHYVVNPALAPPTGLADLQEAVHRLSQATGLTFVFDGLTDEVPVAHRGMAANPRYPNGWPPVLVGWVQRTQTDLLKGDEVGEGGSTWYGVPGAEVYVTGVVAIDATRDDSLAAGFGGSSMGALLMHELGHVVGLDHVDDPTQLMYPTVTSKPAAYGAGDLTGLHLLGRDAGCLAVPAPPWGA